MTRRMARSRTSAESLVPFFVVFDGFVSTLASLKKLPLRYTRYGSDIRSLWSSAGWLSLAIVVVASSRWIVGWEARRRMKTALAISGLKKAEESHCDAASQAKPRPGLIQHTARGGSMPVKRIASCTQHTAHSTQHDSIEERKGHCCDTAMGETGFSTIKAALIGRTA